MNKYIFCSLLLVSSLAQAEVYQTMSAQYSYQGVPEFQAIMNTLKPYSESVDEGKTPPGPRPMSKGEMAVEAAKAKNRAIIAAQTKAEQEGRDKNQDMTELEKWKREEKTTLENWKKESDDTLKSWQREQDIFLGRIKIYQENTFEVPAPEVVIREKLLPVESIPAVHIVNEAFAVPIRDQWNRPTCAAFAGARAIEILLAQNKVLQDLSPQYIYWASKPKCYARPCTQKGSWITPALMLSQKKGTPDIPLTSSCGYNKENVAQNESQTPLMASCEMGKVQVLSFSEIKTLAEAVESIKLDKAVIMAAKLSPNFYKNKGLITLSDAEKDSTAAMDGHSMGHAFLGVGVIELPKALRATEGSYCIVIANSWGKGWGAGGYSCLTESWLTKYRRSSAFVTVNKVSVK